MTGAAVTQVSFPQTATAVTVQCLAYGRSPSFVPVANRCDRPATAANNAVRVCRQVAAANSTQGCTQYRYTNTADTDPDDDGRRSRST